MAGHVRLTYKLNKFFFSELRALRTQIPDAKDVEAKVASGKSFTITVLKAYPKKYNADLSQLRDDTLQSVSRSAIPVGTAIVLFFIIRCLCMLSVHEEPCRCAYFAHVMRFRAYRNGGVRSFKI
eukprot:m.128902 g.128902  ORF g.128902 m.128902 type:complete len:124 (+) comp29359_c1_seq4:252-623(+)